MGAYRLSAALMYVLGNNQTLLHQLCGFFPQSDILPDRHWSLSWKVEWEAKAKILGVLLLYWNNSHLWKSPETHMPLLAVYKCICANIPSVYPFNSPRIPISPLSLETACGALRPASFANLHLLQQWDPSLNCSLPSVHRECIWNCSLTLLWEITIR